MHPPVCSVRGIIWAGSGICHIFFYIRRRDTDTETTDTNFPQQDLAPIIENAQIYYGNIWDATKGHRGEGPGPPAKKVPKKSQSTIINERQRKMRQGKKGKNRARRTDNTWAGRLETWGDTTIQELGALMSTGDNLFTHPTHEGELEWHNLIGSIASLNVAGWSIFTLPCLVPHTSKFYRHCCICA